MLILPFVNNTDEKERVFYITKPNRKLKHSIPLPPTPPPHPAPPPPISDVSAHIPLPHKLKTYDNKTDAVRLALWMCTGTRVL